MIVGTRFVQNASPLYTHYADLRQENKGCGKSLYPLIFQCFHKTMSDRVTLLQDRVFRMREKGLYFF